jgi:hypothetical protein
VGNWRGQGGGRFSAEYAFMKGRRFSLESANGSWASWAKWAASRGRQPS